MKLKELIIAFTVLLLLIIATFVLVVLNKKDYDKKIKAQDVRIIKLEAIVKSRTVVEDVPYYITVKDSVYCIDFYRLTHVSHKKQNRTQQ